MKYSIRKNPRYVKEGEPLYIAQTSVNSIIKKEQILERLFQSTLLPEDVITSVFKSLERKVNYSLKHGKSLELGFLKIDSRGNATVSESFIKAVNEAVKPVKVSTRSKVALPANSMKIIGDLKTPVYHAGDLARMDGYKLAFKVSDIETGVFLVAQNGKATRVTQYLRITQNILVFKLPLPLEPDSYILEVRRRRRNGEIVSGRLEEEIEIGR